MKGPKGWDYLNEYKRTADGRYIYTGISYTLSDFTESVKTLCVFWVLALVTVICSGFISAAGMRNAFYVILPYIGEAVCIFALSWQIVRLIWEKGTLKEYYYKKFINSVPAASFLMSAFAGIGLIGSAVFVILHGFESKPAECVIYFVLKIISLICGISVYCRFKALEWDESDKPSE